MCGPIRARKGRSTNVGVLYVADKKIIRITRLFKDVIYLFCRQGHLKLFFQKTIDFVKNLEMTHIVGAEGSCYMGHYNASRKNATHPQTYV